MDIDLDANATTPVLPQARAAALAAMTEAYGNPSSIHGTGLRARALMDDARARARRVLGAPSGQLLFLSGATEGIQTAVLSALRALRERREAGDTGATLLLYGATEHKAVPEALQHWNEMLQLGLETRAIPVGLDGRHDLAWLREQAPRAGLVCTMAANNETGVVSDLDGIESALEGSTALWLVDGVQALGKLDLQLGRRRIDYAPFSGHKLYGPKGIGMLYVRAGAPLTPLIAGGGQEGAMRSGTENMPGIAALGAVLAALEQGGTFQSASTLLSHRQRLGQALAEAFPGIVFNAPADVALPTTLNFSVPGLASRLLLDLFDAADIRVSGGSACGASKAQPSYVLQAMGLPAWRAASAVRMSFGPATTVETIDEACARIRACGESLRQSCLTAPPQVHDARPPSVTRHVVDGACCYLVTDADAGRCVVIDPLPELTGVLSHWIACRGYTLAAVLGTGSHGDRTATAQALRDALPAALVAPLATDAFGWPVDAVQLELGVLRLTRIAALAGGTSRAAAYLLHDAAGPRQAFVGDAMTCGKPGRADGESLRVLADSVGPGTLLLPGHDPEERHADTLRSLEQPPPSSETVTLLPTQVQSLTAGGTRLLLVDVREPYEQRMTPLPAIAASTECQAVALSALVDALPAWLALPPDTELLFVCRSGNRSAQAARALRKLGRGRSHSLAGGLALWPQDGGRVPFERLSHAGG